MSIFPIFPFLQSEIRCPVWDGKGWETARLIIERVHGLPTFLGQTSQFLFKAKGIGI
jgi:hypothetical protein